MSLKAKESLPVSLRETTKRIMCFPLHFPGPLLQMKKTRHDNFTQTRLILAAIFRN